MLDKYFMNIKKTKHELEMQADFAESVFAEELDSIPEEFFAEFEKQAKNHKKSDDDQFDWPDSTLADL